MAPGPKPKTRLRLIRVDSEGGRTSTRHWPCRLREVRRFAARSDPLEDLLASTCGSVSPRRRPAGSYLVVARRAPATARSLHRAGIAWRSRWGAEHVLESLRQLSKADRLHEEGEVPVSREQVADVRVAVVGHEDDVQAGIQVARPLGEVPAIHPRHPQVGQEEAHLTAMGLEEPERLPAARAAPGL